MTATAFNRTESNRFDATCRKVGPLLSDYVDNTLTARQVWEVEKHLTSCAECAEVARQMQSTVELLRSAEQFDTSDSFMARLHARLDDLEPEPAGVRGLLETLRDKLSGAAATMRARRMPAFTLGIATAALALIIVGNPHTTPGLAVETPPAPEALSRHVAFSASNPFDDPVAAKVEADGLGASDTSPTAF